MQGDARVGITVDSIKWHGHFVNIDPLERLFLGGVPKDFDAKPVPVSRFAFAIQCTLS